MDAAAVASPPAHDTPVGRCPSPCPEPPPSLPNPRRLDDTTKMCTTPLPALQSTALLIPPFARSIFAKSTRSRRLCPVLPESTSERDSPSPVHHFPTPRARCFLTPSQSHPGRPSSSRAFSEPRLSSPTNCTVTAHVDSLLRRLSSMTHT